MPRDEYAMAVRRMTYGAVLSVFAPAAVAKYFQVLAEDKKAKLRARMHIPHGISVSRLLRNHLTVPTR